MRHPRLAFLIAIVAGTGVMGCAQTSAYADRPATHVAASAGFAYDDFYGELAPYGTWVSVSYGWAWCPLDVYAGWRPYTVGRWAYTDWGWMWLAEDPWGSIPYHYGRWAYDDFYGWVWVPGDVWAPAWVSWRYGSGWVGWAPLPPEATWEVGIGFRYTSGSLDRRIDSNAWCFVPADGFLSRQVRGRVVPPSRNVTLISRTSNVTRYDEVRRMPAERGLGAEVIARAAGRSVPRYSLVDSDSPRLTKRPAIRGRRIEVFRPAVDDRVSRDDRLRAEPPERYRSGPPQRLVERQTAEQRRLQAKWREERAQLEREQARERRQPPRGVSREELRRRHEEERQAQERREEHMRNIYRNRQERFGDGRGRERDKDDRQGRADRGRDRGRGRR